MHDKYAGDDFESLTVDQGSNSTAEALQQLATVLEQQNIFLLELPEALASVITRDDRQM